MQNKGFIIVVTSFIAVWCLYIFSFTFVSRGVQRDATAFATDAEGKVDFIKKQAYLDSVWNKPVYNLLGLKEYTYKEVKNNEITLGLDLQGGMHVTLEVSPANIIRALAVNSQDSSLVKALRTAVAQQKNNKTKFSTLFFDAYRAQNPGKRLAPLFAGSSTQERIALNDSDDKVISVIEKDIEEAIERAYTIISKRIDQFGTSEATAQRQGGTGLIQVQIPGAENPARVRKLLSGVAKLEFWDVVEYDALQNTFIGINKLHLADQAKTKKADSTASSSNLNELLSGETAEGDSSSLAKQLATNKLDSLQEANISPLFALALRDDPFRYELKDTSAINRLFKRKEVRDLLPRNVGVFWAAKEDKRRSDDITETPRLQLYFLDLGRTGKSKLTGDVISDARYQLDDKAQPGVSMSMNAKGSRVWAKWTSEAAARSPKGRIAIVLDNLVYSAPSVINEIPNGNSQISGNFDVDEAKDLARVLKAGSLPAPTTIVEEAVIGPTLGQESIQNGLISIVVGFFIIILFMVSVYNRAGWVADLAVLLNLFFLLGILASMNAALTLPGIAGILLSLAIAVDANVLINERVKEDLEEGKPMQVAIQNGYRNAFFAIFDSNMTTLIKGFVLLLFGTGLIYGFAVTLVIGIFCSFFTSVVITRLIFELYTAKGRTISFSFGWSKNLFKSLSFNFIGNRKIFYTVSGVIIIAGMISLAVKGLNYGVDFKGGRTYIVQFDKPVESQEIRDQLADAFGSAPEVKTYGFTGKYQITTSYLIEDPSEEATAQAEAKLVEGMSKFEDNSGTILSSSKVGPTVANDTKISALYALTVAMGLMFLYILVRFNKIGFAMGTMVSLIHTVLMVLALFSLLEGILPFALEIDQAFVAAILTVIGYSINDSVVVFDRVREFLNSKKVTEDTATVVNRALNDTLSRTLITGMSTIFVIIILFIFGGETIKGFTFAMLIGVLIGTYASLCIGTPVLVDITKDEKLQDKADKAKPVTA